MNSSGEKREFPSGACRDSATDKARMELLPLDLLERVARWYGLGADKYGDNNWRKGQPQSAVLGSLLRHLTKWMMGDKTEDHLSAIVWNSLCLMNTDEYYLDNEMIADCDDWFVNSKPTGNGSYMQRKVEENGEQGK